MARYPTDRAAPEPPEFLPRQLSARSGRRRGRLLLLHETGSLMRVAGPIILSQLGAIGMNTMDTLMVGPLGAEALAAAGLGTALHTVMLMVSTGMLMGMGPLISQAFGAGERPEARKVLVQGMWLAGFASLPLMALNFIGAPLARAFDQPPAVAGLVGGYMGALAWGVPGLLLFMALRQYLEGLGRTKPAMVITFLGLGANFIGNQIFIYGVEGLVPAMGVVGAGWSTTLVRWTMLASMVAYVMAQPDLHPLQDAPWRPDRRRLRRIVVIGAPTGVQVGLEVGLFSFAAVMMGWFGTVELGTHQVTINLAATTFMVALGTSIAGSIRVGRHVGARNAAAVRRAVIVTYAVAMGFMGLCALLFLAWPEPLLRLYTKDPAIVALGRELLFMAAVFQLFDGAQVAGVSVLRGAADTRVPMVLALLAYWVVGAPSAWLLGFRTELGPVGVWAGLSLGLAVAAVLLLYRVRSVLWGRPVAPVVGG